MFIGDTVVYDGETFTIVGFTPISVTPAQIEIRPLRGGDSLWIDLAEVTQPVAPQRAALSLAGTEPRPGLTSSHE